VFGTGVLRGGCGWVPFEAWRGWRAKGEVVSMGSGTSQGESGRGDMLYSIVNLAG
jgi:hypothetical protein